MRTASEILAEDPAPAAAASEILEELQAAANRPKIRTPATDPAAAHRLQIMAAGGAADQIRRRCQGGEDHRQRNQSGSGGRSWRKIRQPGR